MYTYLYLYIRVSQVGTDTYISLARTKSSFTDLPPHPARKIRDPLHTLARDLRRRCSATTEKLIEALFSSQCKHSGGIGSPDELHNRVSSLRLTKKHFYGYTSISISPFFRGYSLFCVRVCVFIGIPFFFFPQLFSTLFWQPPRPTYTGRRLTHSGN